MSENVKDQANPSGPIKLKNGWTVEIDREACIGAASCVALAPNSFALDDEAKAIILNGIDTDTEENIIAGAKSCPVDAIIIKDAQGNKIHPK